MPHHKKLSAALKKAQEKNKLNNPELSYRRLAEKLHVENCQISNVMTGRVNYRIDIFFDILKEVDPERFKRAMDVLTK